MTEQDDLSVFKQEPFQKALLQFEELLLQNKPVFLLGAGCSKCAGFPLASELTTHVLQDDGLDDDSKNILEAVKNSFGGGESAQIEDYLSELVDLLAIAERREMRDGTQKTIPLGEDEYDAEKLRNTIEQIKQVIASAIEKKEISIETHRIFVDAVHRPVRVGKEGEASVSVDYLVLNYDTIIEDALALEKIPYSDGIDGGVTGWWNPRTFEQNGLKARVFKLHGSINWHELGDPLPRRVNPTLQINGDTQSKILIWPASTKYRETQLEPFAQLTALARDAITPKPGLQRVLVICGYSFRDEHINNEVERALRESNGNLTIVAFTNENDLIDPLKTWNADVTLRDHVLIFGNRGFFHGEIRETSTEVLSWWKFENVTRILKGER